MRTTIVKAISRMMIKMMMKLQSRNKNKQPWRQLPVVSETKPILNWKNKCQGNWENWSQILQKTITVTEMNGLLFSLSWNINFNICAVELKFDSHWSD